MTRVLHAAIFAGVTLAGVALAGALPFRAVTAADIDARVRARPAGDLAARLAYVTEPFLGAPYRLSPLGEGDGVDADPRIRFDAFDCTTFVETALALAIAKDLDEAKLLLDALRYQDGRVTYLARRHFPEAEWIPQLIQLGFAQDVTRALGGADVVVESKKLDATVWHHAKHDGMPALPDDRIPVGTFSLDVWPLAKAAAHAAQIPAGTLVNIVRVDFSTVPVRVSHQGIIVDHDGKKFLRHAADRMYHSVVDEPIEHFFHRMSLYGKWPVAGVHLMKLQEPKDWRALLHAAPPSTPAPAAPG